MEIPGDLRERIARLGELEQGIFKQVPVIRLKVDLSTSTEHPAVQDQKVLVGQPPPGVAVGGPGVAEVDKQAVDLVRGEVLPQPGRVTIHKKHIGQTPLSAALHGHDHGVRHPLHRQIEHIGILRRGLRCEAAFTAPQLQPDLLRIRLQFPPVPALLLRCLDQEAGAALHPRDQIGLFSHAHNCHLSDLFQKYFNIDNPPLAIFFKIYYTE